MSIWSDMQDRSLGVTKRKEDEIETSIIPDINPNIFCGVVNSITDLPQNVQPGNIYLIQKTSQIVIFWNNIWSPIGYLDPDTYIGTDLTAEG